MDKTVVDKTAIQKKVDKTGSPCPPISGPNQDQKILRNPGPTRTELNQEKNLEHLEPDKGQEKLEILRPDQVQEKFGNLGPNRTRSNKN